MPQSSIFRFHYKVSYYLAFARHFYAAILYAWRYPGLFWLFHYGVHHFQDTRSLELLQGLQKHH